MTELFRQHERARVGTLIQSDATKRIRRLRTNRHHDVGAVNINDSQVHPVALGELGTAHHLASRSVKNYLPLVEQDQTVGELAGQGEVVHCRHDGQFGLFNLGLEQFQ